MRFDGLLREMGRGTTLLVPTQRAARAWSNRLFAARPDGGSPRVLPWGAWAAEQWQTLLMAGYEDRVLLSSLQNTALWTQVLRDAELGTLRPLRSLVRLCTAAQHLVHTYGAADRLLAFHGESGSDIAVFADWFRSYTARCTRDRLLPSSALDGVLATHLEQGTLPLPGTPTHLLGFDHLSPAQQSVVDLLPDSGVLHAAELVGVDVTESTMLRAQDEHHETASLVQTLRTRLHSDLPDNAATDVPILVVLPDAEASRASLDRTLRETFRGTSLNTPLWEFAAGIPLVTLPLVADALDLLRWASGPQDAAIVGRLLQSPFLDLRVSGDRAGELDAEVLRDNRRLRPEWSMNALAQKLKAFAPESTEVLLRLVAVAAQQLRGDDLHGGWAHRMQQVLLAAGWPGKREHSSIDFQRIDRWNELLESFATLDLFERPVSFAAFLADLEDGAADTLFAAENTGAPIQIVSPAETAGITAELLWFAHATEERWAARRSPSPLLPWSLQLEFEMPGVDPARDGDLHRRLTRRVLSSATSVIVSYASVNGDGELRPAPVFDHLKHETVPPIAPEYEEDLLEQFVDSSVFPSLPDGLITGGVGVLKDQAACAFRAFAERRLFSSEPDGTTLGLDPRRRGDLLHTVLETFWNETKTQAKLLELRGSGDLASTLQNHIDAALQAPGNTDAWNAAYLRLQSRRLHALLLRWFDLEAQRPAFRVLHTEHQVQNVAVGPLRFNLRVDRIDAVQTPDGDTALALIDYKTGAASATGWLGPRPDEPQLPLYAVAANLENVGAIAFASVRPGVKNLGLRSMPITTELFFNNKQDKFPEQFERQMEEWYATVQRLAEEFAAGDARVGPKEYPSTCNFCGQRMLCRLNPELLAALGADDDTPSENAE